MCKALSSAQFVSVLQLPFANMKGCCQGHHVDVHHDSKALQHSHIHFASPRCPTPCLPFKALRLVSVNWLSTLSHLMVKPAKQVLSTLPAPTLCVCVSRPDNHSAVPFLTLVEGEHQQGLSSILPLGPINKAAATMAAVLGRPLYPFRLLCIRLCNCCVFCRCSYGTTQF